MNYPFVRPLSVGSVRVEAKTVCADRRLAALLCASVLSTSAIPSTHGAVLVDLDATSLPTGDLPTWQNRGTLPGNFETAGLGIPQVVTRDNARGVLFPSSFEPTAGGHYVGPVAPTGLTGSSPRTIEAWIYDSTPQADKVVVAWGHRGGPDGSNCSFGHGTDPGFGAVAHWGNPGPDLGWNRKLTFNAWSYIAYTFDGADSRVFSDGRLAATEPTSLDTWAVDDNGLPVPIRIARQNSRIGTPSAAGIGELIIGRIRIHDRALSADEIQARFEAEQGSFGLDDPDHDGLPTWFENRYPFLDPHDAADANTDEDQDGLSHLREFQLGTDLQNPDTDGDGLTDGEEVSRTVGGAAAPTNPLVVDTDQDGLSDLEEALLNSDPNEIDTDGDGFPDGQEVLHSSNALDRLSTPELSSGPPAIEIDLTQLAEGPISVLPNTGFLRGDFETASTNLAIVVQDGVRGVRFAGGDVDYCTGPVVPMFLTHDQSRSVEAWVYNPSLEEQETILSWGRRGGPDGTHMALNHGNSPGTGAAVHWRQPDLGWRDRAVAGAWTYVVYVHDAAESSVQVYSDGVQANGISGIILDTWPVDDQLVPRGLRFRLGCQNNSDGTPAPGFRASLLLARVRVYDRALDPEVIAETYRRERREFGRPRFSRIALNAVNQTVQLSWEESVGRRYTVEASFDLKSWQKLGAGIEGQLAVPILSDQMLQYFRIRAE